MDEPSSNGRWHRADLGDRDRTVVAAGGHEIAVFRVGGHVHALDNRCPHAGNPLVEGDLVGETLVCAFHAWRFDVATGACLAGDRPVRRYPVAIRDGDVWVEMPG